MKLLWNIVLCTVYFIGMTILEYWILASRVTSAMNLNTYVGIAIVLLFLLLVIHYVILYRLYKKKMICRLTNKILLAIDIFGTFVGLLAYIGYFIYIIIDGDFLTDIIHYLRHLDLRFYVDILLQFLILFCRCFSIRRIKRQVSP